jgi:mannose-6-phosphate isomerase-like protein (cupin superfamily)
VPAVGRTLHGGAGDSAEFLDTAASTGGACVRLRATVRPGGIHVAPHLHLDQEERFEVLAGRLSYTIGGRAGVAGPGETVVTPRGVVHEHYNAEPDQDLVVIQTHTPALHSDYFFETAYGLAAEGRAGYPRLTFQGAVWLVSLRGRIAQGDRPLWVQQAGAVLIAPVARLMGVRAVYRRFSGEEW